MNLKRQGKRFLKGPKETNSRTANPVPVMRTSTPCDYILTGKTCSHYRYPVLIAFKNRDFPLHAPCSTLYGIAVHVYKFYMASDDPSVKCPPCFGGPWHHQSFTLNDVKGLLPLGSRRRCRRATASSSPLRAGQQYSSLTRLRQVH